MGKAFVGLADDATAASTNPAGLSNLLEQEISFEFSGTQLRHRRNPSLELGDAEQFGSFVFTPTFFSYVLPLNRATFSFYRNSVQNFRESFEFGQRLVPRRDAPEDGAYGRVAIRSENYGVSGAVVVNPWLSVGGSANLSTLDFSSEARSGTRLNPRNGTNTIDSGLSWSAVAGVLVKPTSSVSIGATFTQGSVFELETRLFGRFLYTVFEPDGSVILTGDRRDTEYVIPDRYAAGVSWRVSPALTVLFDATRVRYSERVTEKFLIVDFIDPVARLTPENFYVNDVSEIHAGFEYRLFPRVGTMGIRGGVFTDPDHPLRFLSGGNNPDHPADPIEEFRFNTLKARANVGVTAGWGMALGNRAQVDIAASHSPEATDFVVSMVIRVR